MLSKILSAIRLVWLVVKVQVLVIPLLIMCIVWSTAYRFIAQILIYYFDKDSKLKPMHDLLSHTFGNQKDGSSNVVFCFELEGKLDMEGLITRFQERVLPFETTLKSSDDKHRDFVDPKAVYKPYDVLQWKIVRRYLLYYFEKFDEFTITDHFVQVNLCKEPLNQVMKKYCEFYCGHKFDDSRPQWQVAVVTAEYSTGEESQTSGLIFASHHSYMDGTSFVQMLRYTLADQPFPMKFDPLKFKKERKSLGFLRTLHSFCQCLSVAPLALTFSGEEKHQLTVTSARKSVHSPEESRGSDSRHCLWSRSGLDYEYVKQQATNSSVTTAILTCWTKVMQNVFIKAQKRLPEWYEIGVLYAKYPYDSLRLQNNFTFCFLPIPLRPAVDEETERRCLRQIQKYCVNPFSFRAQDWGSYMRLCLVEPLLSLMARSNIIPCPSVMLSNIVGPEESFSILGNMVKSFLVFPPLKCRMSMAVALVSYNSKIFPSLHVDQVTASSMPGVLGMMDDFEKCLKKISSE